MGRRKRRHPRRALRDAATHAAASDPGEVFDLEIVDDRHGAPHPLEDVASALDTGRVVDPARVAESTEAAAPQRAVAPQGAATDSAVPAPRQASFTDLGDKPHADASATEAAGAAEGAVAVDDAPDESQQDVQTLGELLQQARESRGLSIEETSARTRISLKMLGHLENDRFGEFAADAYVKGFLRNYGNFLGLDVDMLVRRYETLAGHVVEAPPAVWEEVVEVRRPRKRWKPRRRTVSGFAVVVMVGVLAWVFWSRGAAKLGLRPTPALQQIENELREAPERMPRLQAGIDAAPPLDPATADGSDGAAQPVDAVADAESENANAAAGATAGSAAKPVPATAQAASGSSTTRSTPSATTASAPATSAPPNSSAQKPVPTQPSATTPAITKPATSKPAPATATPPNTTQPATPKPEAQSAAPAQRKTTKPTSERTRTDSTADAKPAKPEAKKPATSKPPPKVAPKPKPKPKPPASADSPPPPEPEDPPR